MLTTPSGHELPLLPHGASIQAVTANVPHLVVALLAAVADLPHRVAVVATTLLAKIRVGTATVIVTMTAETVPIAIVPAARMTGNTPLES